MVAAEFQEKTLRVAVPEVEAGGLEHEAFEADDVFGVLLE